MTGGGTSLSVVIPTIGRETVLRTVESLLAMEGGTQCDIIVAGKIADGAVASRLAAICAAHGNVRHLQISFETGDSSRKKNAGAAAAQGEIVAFVDDDVVVAPDWAEAMLAAFADAQVGLASGPSLVPDDINEVGRQAGLALSSRAAGYVAERYRQNAAEPYAVDWDRVIGCNAAYRREAFAEMGGFPADFYPGEEMMAAFRTERKGWKLLFVPGARVWHYPRQGVARFWRQMWGYGATRIRLIRGGVSWHPAPLVPGLWVAATLALAAAAPFSRLAALLLAADLATYAAMAWAVALETVWHTKRPGDWRVFPMILIMHAAYGLAEWRELFAPGRDFSERA
jgi:GT2 family glycosyltransferase